MRKTYLNLSFLFVLIAAISCNNREQSASGSHDSNEVAEEQNDEKFDDASKEVRNDADFVAEEVADNHAEVELARVALERTNNPEIKRIANDLIKAHEMKIKELGKLASAKAITVPNEPEDSDLKTLTNLREEKDIADFNKKWCKEAIDQHDEAIKEYEDQLDDTKDAELKTWISNTLPSLRKHRDELQACHDKLKDA